VLDSIAYDTVLYVWCEFRQKKQAA